MSATALAPTALAPTALGAAAKPSPAPSYDPTGGWGTVMPYSSTIALVGGAVVVLLLLVAGLVVLRAPRAGMAGKGDLRRQLGRTAMHRGAAELRPGGTARPAPREARPEHVQHAENAENAENQSMGDPRCVATERL